MFKESRSGKNINRLEGGIPLVVLLTNRRLQKDRKSWQVLFRTMEQVPLGITTYGKEVQTMRPTGMVVP